MKICNKCGETKPFSEFNKDKSKPDGYRYECKSCKQKKYKENVDHHNSLARARYQKNIDHFAEYRASRRDKNREAVNTHYIRNKDKILQYHKEYYQNNKEHLSELHKLYDIENPEVRKEAIRKWRSKNPEFLNFMCAKRRAARKQATPKWANMDKIREFYKESVRLTKETGIQHSVDHIIPLQHELVCGLHVETNLQILTHSENCRKNNTFKI